MDPVTRSDHNYVYYGPSPDIGNLSCYRERLHEGWSHWKPTEEELELLNNGGHVAIGLFREPIPPIAVGVISGMREVEA